jgi:protein SCO1/2
MQTVSRAGLIALLVAIAAGGIVWHVTSKPQPARQEPDLPAVGQASKALAGQATGPTMPPPETFAAVFTPCAHCHEIGQDARPMTGPPLTGIIGRKAASTPHYPYSQALRDSAITWDEATLARFIADPQAVVPGTRMMFGGQPQPQIGALVAFIKTTGQGEAGGGATSQQDPSQTSSANSNDAAKTLPASTLAIGGPFTLVDSKGRSVTQNDLLGKPSAIFFGYTNCPDICPTTLLDLTRLMKEMGADADRLNVVFITIDPARDTSAELATYLSSFDPRIRGFTGTDAEIAAVAKAYHVYYQRVPNADGGYSMDHTATVYLMDAEGGFSGTLSYEEDDKTSLAKLERLVRSAS